MPNELEGEGKGKERERRITLFHQMSRAASLARSRDAKGPRRNISRANRVLPQQPRNPASVIVSSLSSSSDVVPRRRATTEAEALSTVVNRCGHLRRIDPSATNPAFCGESPILWFFKARGRLKMAKNRVRRRDVSEFSVPLGPHWKHVQIYPFSHCASGGVDVVVC